MAQEGATTNDVLGQIRENTQIYSEHPNIDVYLSMLGNDLVVSVVNGLTPQEMESLTHGRLSPLLLRKFISSACSGMSKHQDGVRQVIAELSAQHSQGASINRLFIQGMPDVGQASELEVVLGEGNIGQAIPLSLDAHSYLRRPVSFFS